MTESQSEQIASLLSVNNDISRISERLVEVANVAGSQREGKMVFSEAGQSEIHDIFRVAIQAYTNVITALSEKDKGLAETVVTDITKYHKYIKRSNKNHLKRWKDKECDESLVNAYPEILTSLQRIGDNCLSLAEEVLEDTELMILEPQRPEENHDENTETEVLTTKDLDVGASVDSDENTETVAKAKE